MRNNANSGYVGYSRSVRSQRAIDQYEVPLSHIKRILIDDFLLDNKEEYRHYLEMFEKNSVVKWKFVATEIVGRASDDDEQGASEESGGNGSDSSNGDVDDLAQQIMEELGLGSVQSMVEQAIEGTTEAQHNLQAMLGGVSVQVMSY